MADERARSERIAGVDGCRAGWVVVRGSVEHSTGGSLRIDSIVVAPTIAPLVQDASIDLVAIDMPIGLPDDGPRECDRACRAALGPRRSSVFPTPVRSVLEAADYGDALDRSRRVTGVGLSVQAWNLVPRIAELDEFLGSLGGTVTEDRVKAMLCLIGAMPEYQLC